MSALRPRITSLWKYICRSPALIVLIGAVPEAYGQQVCSLNILESTPSFSASAIGTVTDLQTGLIWKRCAEGQGWDSASKSCTGTALGFSWSGALQQARIVNNGGGFAGFADWRVPNIKELRSLVEEKCHSPAINVSAFPGTAATSHVWSSSPADAKTYALSVSFDTGRVPGAGRSEMLQVRLVRGGGTYDAFVLAIAQTITFGPAPGIGVGGVGNVSTTGGASGNPVVLGSATPSICAISGSVVTGLAAGTCTVTADQAGNSTHFPAPQATQSFVVDKGAQTIAFEPLPDRDVGSAPFTISATGGASGFPVVFSSTTTQVCNTAGTNGASVVLFGVGICTIAADQAGNANYFAANQVTRSFGVKIGQVIEFGELPDRALGDPQFTLTAKGGASGLPVTFSTTTTAVCQTGGSGGALVAMVGLGTCAIAANQPGTAIYNSAPTVTRSFTVLPADATPEPFALVDQTNVFVNREVTSAPVAIRGINTSAEVKVSGGTYSVGCSGAFTAATGSVSNGQTVCVRHMSAAAPGGVVDSTLTVGGVSDTFTSYTASSNVDAQVASFYRTILRREADPAGQAYWENEAARVVMLGGSINEAWFAMAQAFFRSAEYIALSRDNPGYVSDLFNTFFNREPDQSGLAYWVDQLTKGMPREVVLAAYMFSPEYRDLTQSLFGPAATRIEVDTVMDFFRGLLARLPDGSGLNFWLRKFRAAQCDGGDAVNAEVESISSQFVRSDEYNALNRSDGQYVGDLYNAFLRRGGDLGGVLFWINQIATRAQTREQVRQQFVASPEFQARVAAIINQGCV